MYYVSLIFVLVAGTALVTELLTRAKIAVMVIPGALAAAIIALFDCPFRYCIVLFLGLTAAVMILAHFLRAGRKVDDQTDGAEGAIGMRCVVSEDIDNVAGAGLATFRGHEWAARSLEDSIVFRAGETVTVVAVEGVKLICKN